MNIPTNTTKSTSQGEAITASGLRLNSLTGPGSTGDVSRIMILAAKRQNQIEEFERTKRKIDEDSQRDLKFGSRFELHKGDKEEMLRRNTIGLVTNSQFVQIQQNLDLADAQKKLAEKEKRKQNSAKKRKPQVNLPTVKKLSFATDDDDMDGKQDIEELLGQNNDEQITLLKRQYRKDPTIDTTFLPDHERELKEEEERARLAEQYEKEMTKQKQEKIDVTFSMWDGSGHRLGEFLGQVLRAEQKSRSRSHEGDGQKKGNSSSASDLRFATKYGSSNELMFVKEDVILPHHITFHDLIVSKARGKSGPLWNWDVHDDVRMEIDTRIEKDESHAAKVVDRQWYEQNKHIFPVNRWDIYDPAKKYETYTIHDKSAQNT
ncbi:MAG: putative Protein FAM50 [Streblomastix strix]|uniref:FAM50A/XAP5 C-terminal domain-containing protein n=2 Tax=Streblomastix strix TaxID=222440 RepID=A0A5J4V0A8_9EUKA|nr:MAG: putative Protein FAM50 [Streblomastix strix]